MTYNVFSGMLNPTQSIINQERLFTTTFGVGFFSHHLSVC